MQRAEVWLINLSPTLGAEMQKTRPAVVVNDDDIGVLPLKVVVPITDWKEHYAQAPWLVRLQPTSANGLAKISAADAFQVRSLSEQRFVRRIGVLAPEAMAQIAEALKAVLKLRS